MYYLTITRDGQDVIRRKAFDDYDAAIEYTSQFYRPRHTRCVLEFTTEVINGKFARSFGTLNRPEGLDENGPYYKERYHVAAKQANSFDYDYSYLFVIESECGIRDVEDMRSAYEQE